MFRPNRRKHTEKGGKRRKPVQALLPDGNKVAAIVRGDDKHFTMQRPVEERSGETVLKVQRKKH